MTRYGETRKRGRFLGDGHQGRAGETVAGDGPDALLELLLTQGDIELLGITSPHLRRLLTLPHHHRDPFDRLMIAQALVEGWEVISSDDLWDAYGVTRIW